LPAKFDEYTRNARLKPVFITTIPLALVCVALGVKTSVMTTLLIAPLTSLGCTALITQFTRDIGRSKEPSLYTSWGGKPTTVKLRHSDASLNPLTRARYHEKLQKIMNKTIPGADAETRDPAGADLIYETAGDFLREKTRDTNRFRLLFEELMSYGFRRNLWSLKPFGLTMSAACTAITTSLVVFNGWSGEYNLVACAAALLNWLFLIWWLFWISPEWVRRSANEYATRLLASLDDL
jgi:hypothetical protein